MKSNLKENSQLSEYGRFHVSCNGFRFYRKNKRIYKDQLFELGYRDISDVQRSKEILCEPFDKFAETK